MLIVCNIEEHQRKPQGEKKQRNQKEKEEKQQQPKGDRTKHTKRETKDLFFEGARARPRISLADSLHYSGVDERMVAEQRLHHIDASCLIGVETLLRYGFFIQMVAVFYDLQNDFVMEAGGLRDQIVSLLRYFFVVGEPLGKLGVGFLSLRAFSGGLLSRGMDGEALLAVPLLRAAFDNHALRGIQRRRLEYVSGKDLSGDRRVVGIGKQISGLTHKRDTLHLGGTRRGNNVVLNFNNQPFVNLRAVSSLVANDLIIEI